MFLSNCSLCFLLVLTISFGDSLKMKPPVERISPEIRVTHWQEAGEMEWTSPAVNVYDPDLINFNATTSSMSISNNIAGVILTCSANYPIEWISDVGEQLLTSRKSYFLRGRTSREALDVYVEQSYSYSVDLNFRGNFKEFTGNYTCRKINTDLLSSSLYMFWEGVTAQYLVQSGTSLDVLLQPAEDRLVIPCRVCIDDVKVILLKSIPDMYFVENFHRLELNDSVIDFDPKVGFILNRTSMADPYGTYKCVTDQENDFVITRVNRSLDGPRADHHVDVLKRRASFSYDPKQQLLTCCSNKNTQPTIYPGYCQGPVSCKFYEKALARGIASLQQKLTMYHREVGRRNKSCTSMPLHEGMMGYFQCVGDGIDVVRTLFTSIPIGSNDTIQAYSTWDDIDSSKLVAVSVNENLVELTDGYRRRHGGFQRKQSMPRRHGRRFMYRPRHQHLLKTGHLPENVYAGESFNFSCKASSSYFAHGSQLTVSYTDGRVHKLPLDPQLSTHAQELSNSPVFSFARVTIATATVTLDQNMSLIVCHAPVYNSTKWVRQELKLNVKDPVLPAFPSGQDDEIVYWTLNDTDNLIECKASGQPPPLLNLTLNGKEIKSGKDDMLTESESGNLKLKVRQVSHESHGDYICTAYNVAGVVQKKFTVIVLEPTHWALVVSLSVTLSILLVAFVLVVLKFQLQKKLRDRLLSRF